MNSYNQIIPTLPDDIIAQIMSYVRCHNSLRNQSIEHNELYKELQSLSEMQDYGSFCKFGAYLMRFEYFRREVDMAYNDDKFRTNLDDNRCVACAAWVSNKQLYKRIRKLHKQHVKLYRLVKKVFNA